MTSDVLCRVVTQSGPRTFSINNLSRRDASEIAHALRTSGHECALIESRGGKPMRDHLKALKKKQRLQVVTRPANVASLAEARKGRG